jgi:hypothetical protein
MLYLNVSLTAPLYKLLNQKLNSKSVFFFTNLGKRTQGTVSTILQASSQE